MKSENIRMNTTTSYTRTNLATSMKPWTKKLNMEPPMHETDENKNQTSPPTTLAPVFLHFWLQHRQKRKSLYSRQWLCILTHSKWAQSRTGNQNLNTRNTRSDPTRPRYGVVGSLPPEHDQAEQPVVRSLQARI